MSNGLLSQLEMYYSEVDEAQDPIRPDEVSDRMDAVRVLPAPLLPLRRSRSTRKVWVALAAAAVAIALIGTVTLLISARTNDVPPATTPVVTEQSLSWTVVEAVDAPHMLELSWVPDVLHAGSRYFVSLMPDILRAADEPVVPNELWASDDGLIWELDRMPVEELVAAGASRLEAQDTAAFQLADRILVDPYGRWDPVVRSDDGVTWTVADVEPDSAGGVVWKVDNAEAMTEVRIPWIVGGFTPTGWIFEFADGYAGLQVTPPFGDRSVAQPFEAYHSPDGQNWSRVDAPAFADAGYDHFDRRVGFAHQHGVALAVLSDADPRDPLQDAQFRMWRSDDGITWTNITPQQLNGAGVWALEGAWLQGPSFMTGDGAATFQLSPDGEQWDQIDVPVEFANFQGEVRVAGNKIFVFGEDRLLVATYTP